jgi:hypothetical protein
MRTMTIAVLALLIGLMIFPVAAQDDVLPTPDPADNLCYEGGAWDDGRCEIPAYEGATALAWECGWYFARLYSGELRREDMPTRCVHLMSAGGVSELCREIAANNVLCFYANQTGTLFVNGSPLLVYRFVSTLPASSANCPTLAGYSALLTEATTVQVQPSRFTSDQLFGQLGLQPFYCLYVDV